ncbi:MAG TPA: hypothetical protein PKD54_02200 [Pirellulaceae bacterium]|nr:hypothetical protein [Pirellulaceae bacterium]
MNVYRSVAGANSRRSMKTSLHFRILSQPDELTCGPTCLQAVYRFFGDDVPLETVIADIPSLDEGGTLAVLLGCHALRRGYTATIYTFNLKVFDPTWFNGRRVLHAGQDLETSAQHWRRVARKGREMRFQVGDDQAPQSEHLSDHQKFLIERLSRQQEIKESQKLKFACRSYAEFLSLGGQVAMHDLNTGLISHYLDRNIPVLTGLSATYLYRCEREIARNCKPDDVRGVPTGHFVVLSGYHPSKGTVSVADPYLANPLGDENYYDVHVERLICAILLGVITYDANLLIVQPSP